MTVDDDGRGCSAIDLTAGSADGHVGLHSLAHLAADLGGALTVRSAIDVGTQLVVRLPAPALAVSSRAQRQDRRPVPDRHMKPDRQPRVDA